MICKIFTRYGNEILNDSNNNIEIPECRVTPINADIVDIYGNLIRKKFIKLAKCARNVAVDEINK